MIKRINEIKPAFLSADISYMSEAPSLSKCDVQKKGVLLYEIALGLTMLTISVLGTSNKETRLEELYILLLWEKKYIIVINLLILYKNR